MAPGDQVLLLACGCFSRLRLHPTAHIYFQLPHS